MAERSSAEVEAAQSTPLSCSLIRPDTHIEPKQVSHLILRINALVRKLLPVEISKESVKAPDGLINASVVLNFARAGGDLEDVVPFALLEDKKLFEVDKRDEQLNSLRASACEILARRVVYQLLKKESSSEQSNGTFQCLSKRFAYIDAEGDTTLPTSALESAVDQSSVAFLSSPEAQECIQAIWTGRLTQEYGDHQKAAYFVPYKSAESGSFREHFGPKRLAVPRTLYTLSLVTWLAFLVVYSLATQEFTGLDVWEVALWVMLLAYILEDLVRWWKVQGLEALSIWLVIDILQNSLSVAAFTVRVISFIYEGPDHTADYQRLSFQLLACLAPLLWIQLLKAFDCVPFFGNILNSLARMLKETGIFLVLLGLTGAGFAQSLASLDAADGHRVENSGTVIVDTLLSGILGGGLEFDSVNDAFGKPFGKILLYCYSFVQVLLLSNILIALLNQAYQDVVDDADDVFAAYFASKVIGLVRAPDQFVYPAPFNLIEAFLIAPLEYVLPRKAYRRLNEVVQSVLFSVPLFVIALYESRVDSQVMRSIRLEMLGATDDPPESLAAAVGQDDFTTEDPDSPSTDNDTLTISRVPFKKLAAVFPNIKSGSDDDEDRDSRTGEVATLKQENDEGEAPQSKSQDDLLRELLTEIQSLKAEIGELKKEKS